MKIDVLVDVQRGDCGKGKISKSLNEKNGYGIIAKYNGGGNAGHAVWIGDKKYTAHYLTSGMYDPKTQIVIGCGCVLNPKEFLNEYNQFNEEFKLDGRVFIHPYTHIITDEHIAEDQKDKVIGTTGKGIGPTYMSKYARTGIRAEQVEELKPFLLKNSINTEKILMEGSQGWWLDIDHGSYPYVTSSHIHPGFAFTTFGLPLRYLNKVYGVAKIYETYVGKAKDLVICSQEDANIIREAGKEYGETTGRPREIGYLNLNDLAIACNQCGVDTLYINKCDILEQVNIFKVIENGNIQTFGNIKDMIDYVENYMSINSNIDKIIFSGTRDGLDIK